MEQTISSTTNSPLSSTPVLGNNADNMLNASPLQVNPSATIVVNSIDDVANKIAGVTTLRDAVNQANAEEGSDLIVFDQSLFSKPQTINLTLGELDITHSLDIMAPKDSLTGESLLTVSGNNSSRVFEIEAGATVNLSGLIIANGKVTGDNGGGIKNSGTLTLDSSTVRNNSATKVAIAGGDGAGIYNSGGLTVSNSTISANQASLYGGIYNSGDLTVSNSTISANAANIGGGLYNNGKLTVSDSTIRANQADISGGIENTTRATLVLTNTTISTNSATNSDGGIRNLGTADINNSVINNNTAGFESGGIGVQQGSVKVSNSRISGNTARFGGGITNFATLIVSNSIIRNNVATFEGGGLSVQGGTVTVSNSRINGNNSGASGGGILTANGSTLTLSNSTISSNSTSGISNGNGGGIYNSRTGDLRLVFSTLTLNQATNGSGLYNDNITNSRSVSVRNTIIAQNLPINQSSVNPDVAGTFVSGGFNSIGGFISGGYNLIGNATGSTGFGQATGDIIGTSDQPIDPLLAPLDFYGSTQTIALLPNSPAIGAADPKVLDTDPTTDQRGLSRPKTGKGDIGAFELSVA
ncbi:MAG: hypothetical protein DSM106950_24910 [Stigonema ocellatum SAG 48.90 = DSM 106950]|nr:hypothetical protein [Stigonema ocellatum SAG 48.90 = DSM 106950]